MLTDEEYDLMRWEDDGGYQAGRTTEAIESITSAPDAGDADGVATPHAIHQGMLDISAPASLAAESWLP